MDTPKATLEISGKSSDAIAAGVIAPKLDRQDLINAGSKYGADQTGAIIYIKDATTGTATAKEAKITSNGYYYFDGTIWQPLLDNVTADRIAGGTKGEVLTADASGNVLWAPFVAGKFSIGLDSTAARAALLDVKSVQSAAGAVTDVTDDANVTSNDGGLLLPRVKLVNDSTLEPFITTTDAQWTANSDALKERHAGLMVYNLTEDESENLSPGIYYWDSKKWDAVQKGTQKALFSVECSAIEVRGSYGTGKSLDNSHYLKLNIINVTRGGSYSITATSEVDNGFFFEATGNFYTTGNMTLSIPGTGQPINPGNTNFILTISGGADTCRFVIPVIDLSILPKFTMNCGATEVFGTYYEDSVMTTDNYMEIHLTVDPTAFGATAEFQTEEVDGFSFSGTAVLNSNPQTVRLQATGKPYSLNDKVFHVTSNSVTNTGNCRETVYMSIPAKRIMTTGLDSYFNYNIGLLPYTAEYTRAPNSMITDKNNFGPYQHSILRFKGFTNKPGSGMYPNVVSNANAVDDGRDIVAILDPLMTGTGATDMTAVNLGKWLRGKDGQAKIDILYLGYAAEWCPVSVEGRAKADTIIDFMRRGGIVIITCQLPVTSRNFFNRLFFGTDISTAAGANAGPIGSTTGSGPGTLYNLGYTSHNVSADQLAYFAKSDDPILTGPFENIVGRCWGEDASATAYLTNLPMDSVVVYASARPTTATLTDWTGIPHNSATVFRHVNLPLIYFGDGGFNSAGVPTYGGTTSCPFELTSKVINGHTYPKYPTYRNFGSSAPNRSYNAVLLANAMAWCIYQAEENRRNSK
jgi:hypothetical protein